MPAEMVALTSYQPFPEKSNGPENMILVYICEYALKIFIFVEITREYSKPMRMFMRNLLAFFPDSCYSFFTERSTENHMGGQSYVCN